jgi:hypothetical protein
VSKYGEVKVSIEMAKELDFEDNESFKKNKRKNNNKTVRNS